MKPTKRTLLKAMAAGLAAPYTSASRAQERWPNRVVSIVVPYPAGSFPDTTTRAVIEPLSKILGQSVVIENVSGAGGLIGAQKVLNSPADGYTVYRGSLSELVLVPMTVPSVTLSSNDFRLVQANTVGEFVLMTRKGLPVDSVDALIRYAAEMEKQGKLLTYASAGTGSIYHLLGEKLCQLAGIKATHVPYRSPPAEQALLAEEIDFYISLFLPQHQEYNRTGRVKILSLLTQTRHPRWPEYPAIGEYPRVKDLAFTSWGGFFVKQGTPEPIAEILNKALGQMLADEKINAMLTAMNQRVATPLNLAEAERQYQAGVEQFRALGKSAGL